MIDAFKRLLPHELRQRLKRSIFAQHDMHTRLANLRRAGFVPVGAVDGGAHRGDWTITLWTVWPNCPSVLIEPLPDHTTALSALAAKNPGSRVVAKAIGRTVGVVRFRSAETNSGIVKSDATDEGLTRVACTTLDVVLEQAGDIHPNLLKLDLQGHELEALAGCQLHLRDFEVILLEVSLLRIGDVPIFSEVHRCLDASGYRLYDVLPAYYRPLDGALWQIDAFYVREDSDLISSRQWQ